MWESVQSAGIMRQRWPDKVMQNENFIERRPQTFVDTATYVRDVEVSMMIPPSNGARIMRQPSETLTHFTKIFQAVAMIPPQDM